MSGSISLIITLGSSHHFQNGMFVIFFPRVCRHIFFFFFRAIDVPTFTYKLEHAFTSEARLLVGMQLLEKLEPSVISAMLIMCPRASSTLIQLKTLMAHNEPRSFPHCLTNQGGI